MRPIIRFLFKKRYGKLLKIIKHGTRYAYNTPSLVHKSSIPSIQDMS